MAGAMGGRALQAAINVAKAAAKNEKVRATAATAAMWVGKKGGSAVSAKRTNRRRAFALARQVGGKYSEGTIVANRERIVIWKDGKAIDCFPALTDAELQGAKLNERHELQGFNQNLLNDPPPLKPKG